jgi:hypothetical protein
MRPLDKIKSVQLNSEFKGNYIRLKDDFQDSLTLLPDYVELSFSDGIYLGQIHNHKIRNGKGAFVY